MDDEEAKTREQSTNDKSPESSISLARYDYWFYARLTV